MATSDKSSIWLTLYTIRRNKSGSLEAVKTKEERVYSYSGGFNVKITPILSLIHI